MKGPYIVFKIVANGAPIVIKDGIKTCEEATEFAKGVAISIGVKADLRVMKEICKVKTEAQAYVEIDGLAES